MENIKKKLRIFLCLVGTIILLTSCKSDDFEDDAVTPLPETPTACFESGDIIVSNSGSDAVTVLDHQGNFKRTAYNVNTAIGEAFYGMEIHSTTGELLLVVDGSDRVMAISPTDCTARNFIQNPQLNGNIRGLTQLISGDVLVIETNVVERFTTGGDRVTSGGWPRTLQTAGTEISAMASGGFVLCSSGADVVRTYNDAGTQVATRASGIAATTDAMGCRELSNGTIAAAWSGTSDSVVVYSSNLVTALHTYSNPSVLGAPGGMAQRANGNILVIDRVFHYVVELTSEAVYVGTMGAGLLNIPEKIIVVP